MEPGKRGATELHPGRLCPSERAEYCPLECGGPGSCSGGCCPSGVHRAGHGVPRERPQLLTSFQGTEVTTGHPEEPHLPPTVTPSQPKEAPQDSGSRETTSSSALTLETPQRGLSLRPHVWLAERVFRGHSWCVAPWYSTPGLTAALFPVFSRYRHPLRHFLGLSQQGTPASLASPGRRLRTPETSAPAPQFSSRGLQQADRPGSSSSSTRGLHRPHRIARPSLELTAILQPRLLNALSEPTRWPVLPEVRAAAILGVTITWPKDRLAAAGDRGEGTGVCKTAGGPAASQEPGCEAPPSGSTAGDRARTALPRAVTRHTQGGERRLCSGLPGPWPSQAP
ncbi:uncharacterized protein LOC104867431 [Fukomys damarensis]|uniref:uncharacterized protein LOC104867431 n=1 Tax=Fukomys damarensis TaxID=885580 RepID=UPI0005400C85|nr:uncharacterized protein LOC104867431 [Fukomys damarensis]